MAFTEDQKKWVFVVLFAFLIIISIYMVRPYLSALFVGALIAYFIHPTYNKLLTKVKRPLFAQAIITAVTVLILVALAILIILPLASQTQTLYQTSEHYASSLFNNGLECTDATFYCNAVTDFKELTSTPEFQEKSRQTVEKASLFLFQSISSVASSVFSFVLSLFILIYALFYFLGHGQKLSKDAINSLPLPKKQLKAIIARLKSTLDAVVRGNISTALLQGLLGGIMFAILGIPLSFFWGMVMAILAFIPAVGTPIVWVPAVVILAIQGSFVKAITLAIFSLTVLNYIDNILKPKLIGDKIKMSSFIIFLSVIGGLQAFGILGLFFGPVIFALLNTFYQMYRKLNA